MTDSSQPMRFNRAVSHDTGEPWPDNYARWLIPSMDEANRLANELESTVKDAQDERPIQDYFEKNPSLLVQLVRGGHGRWVFPKPKLGSEYIPDFMICEEDSGGYHWHLVELENPNHDTLTRSGAPSAKLTHALRQVSDWRIWLRKNSQYAQNQLGYLGLDGEFEAIVVIGRRNNTNEGDRERYRELSRDKVEIMSYDRLVERVISLAKGWRQFHDDWLNRDSGRSSPA